MHWAGYLSRIPGSRVFVYNDGPTMTDEVGFRDFTILPGDGAPCESGKYLKFIVDHYDDLNEFTVFSQADPFMHSPDFIGLLHAPSSWEPVQNLTYRYLEGWGPKEEQIVESEAMRKCFVRGNLRVYTDSMTGGMQGTYWPDHWIERDLPTYVKVPAHRIVDYFSHRFGFKPRDLRKAYCACFAVRKDCILKHPKRLYEDLLAWFLSPLGGSEDILAKNFISNNTQKSRAVLLEYLWLPLFDSDPGFPPITFEDVTKTQTGFGDRLLDCWFVATVAELWGRGSRIECLWADGLERGRTYSPELFSVNNVQFVREHHRGDPIGRRKINLRDDEANFPCITFTQDTHRNPGTAPPWRLRGGGLTPWRLCVADKSPEEVAEAFLKAASSTRPCHKIEDLLFSDDGVIGMHLRMTDKIKASNWPVLWECTVDEFQECYDRALEYAQTMIAKGSTNFFVSSDDCVAGEDLRHRLREMGATVLTVDCRGEGGDLVDFFALSRCARIVQMTKYSTFSMAASMIRRVPLVNFHGTGENMLDIWKGSLSLSLPVGDMVLRKGGVQLRHAHSGRLVTVDPSTWRIGLKAPCGLGLVFCELTDESGKPPPGAQAGSLGLKTRDGHRYLCHNNWKIRPFPLDNHCAWMDVARDYAWYFERAGGDSWHIYTTFGGRNWIGYDASEDSLIIAGATDPRRCLWVIETEKLPLALAGTETIFTP